MITNGEREQTVAVVWPTIGATPMGRWVGRLAGARLPADRLRLVGKVMAAATIPVSLAVYFWQLMPFVARRYRVTDRRVVIEKGLSAVSGDAVELAQFDAVEVQRLPGQEWLRTGDVVFRCGEREVLRLAGVPNPEAFRAMCRDVQSALAGTN